MPFPVRLGPTALTGSQQTMLTSPQNLRWTDAAFANPTSSPINVTVWIVPVGSTPLVTNQFFGTINVPPNDLLVYAFNIVLNAGDRIIALGSGVNFFATISDEKN